ncbi:MAG TPA: ATP-binding protein [Terriglobales bacterium]|nr:ATP-binding protein [Terriglobales bacterium]
MATSQLSFSAQKRRLLIADDDAIFRIVASDLVESWGYDPVTVDNGQDALKILLQERPPTIAMLDWLMPKLTGLEICQKIRSGNPRQYTYFILVSARDGRDDALEGLHSGADTYITKPLDADELQAKLKVADRILFMEESLRDLHAETELFISAVPSILIGTDMLGRVSRWNQVAQRMFGLTRQQVEGKTLAACGIPWKEFPIEAQVLEVLKTGMPSPPCDLAIDNEHARRLLTLNIHPLRSHVGSVVGSLIVGADVTEKKMLDDQLRQAQKLEGIGQLAAGIAHEINTPTQFVSSNVTFLKEAWSGLSGVLTAVGKLPASESKPAAWSEIEAAAAYADIEHLAHEMPRALDEALEGLERIARIVHAMKAFSHPGSSQRDFTDLNRAIQSTVTVASNEWRYVADLETDFDPNLPPVPCLVDKINQVILNLVINAAHSIGERTDNGSRGKGLITVRTQRTGENVEISIADTGAGIPETIRHRIFELFFSTKEVGRGTGQGLALAHSTIVTEHKGKIWFESQAGKGTTFFIQLPLQVVADEVAARPAGT